MKAFGKKQKKPSAKESANPNIVVGDHVAPKRSEKLRKKVGPMLPNRKQVLVLIIVVVFGLVVVAGAYVYQGQGSKNDDTTANQENKPSNPEARELSEEEKLEIQKISEQPKSEEVLNNGQLAPHPTPVPAPDSTEGSNENQ